jgi:hypothetical protein
MLETTTIYQMLEALGAIWALMICIWWLFYAAASGASSAW